MNNEKESTIGTNKRRKIKDRLQHMSMRKKIHLLILSITICILLVLLASVSLFSNNALINMTIDSSTQNLTLISQKLDMLTQDVESTAVFILTHDDVQEWLTAKKEEQTDEYALQDKVSGYFNNVLKYDFISNLMIYPYKDSSDKYSTFNYHDPNESEFVELLYGQPYFDKWYMNKDVRFSYVVNSKNSPYSLIYYKKVYNKLTIDPIGMVGIMVNESSLSKLYRNIKLGESGHYFIVDHDGNVISSVQQERLGDNISDMPYYQEAVASHNGIRTNIDGVDNLVFISKYEKLDWMIIGIVPLSEVTEANRSLRVFSIIIGILLLIATIFLSDFLSNYISKPIIHLRKIVTGIGTGKGEIEISTDRYDEIGELYTAFSNMLYRLDDLTEEIIGDNNRQKESELALLQAQLNPHFLYNTLECIRGLSMVGKNEDVINATTELAKFYRSVFSSMSKFVTVIAELNTIRAYFSIIQFRFPEKLTYSIQCDPAAENCGIIKLCIQPIVENAIVHGLRNCRHDWEIGVIACRCGDKMMVIVEDNGVGMTQEKIDDIFKDKNYNKTSMNFGIRATDERIKLSFGNQYGVTVQSEYGKWTRVMITFPDRPIEQYIETS